MSTLTDFEAAVSRLSPRTAVVLGSGLDGAATQFHEAASIPFADVPGLVPPTVSGHRGRLAVGIWDESPVLIFFGRLHFYEGHPPEVVTGIVRVAASFGAKRLVLTNAAGGIHPALEPGSLMVIRGHFKLVGSETWREIPKGEALVEPYYRRLIQTLVDHESASDCVLPVGVYAALTGACYETPAEIRMLAACGADAVGMSTALEAEAAAELGLEVVAISCITNRAAGLGGESLDHAEVLVNAKLAVEWLRELIGVTLTA